MKIKANEFVTGMIVWVNLIDKSNRMWPSIIEKVEENSKKVYYKYFDSSKNCKNEIVFCTDSSRVELFFRDNKKHFDNKVI